MPLPDEFLILTDFRGVESDPSKYMMPTRHEPVLGKERHKFLFKCLWRSRSTVLDS